MNTRKKETEDGPIIFGSFRKKEDITSHGFRAPEDKAQERNRFYMGDPIRGRMQCGDWICATHADLMHDLSPHQGCNDQGITDVAYMGIDHSVVLELFFQKSDATEDVSPKRHYKWHLNSSRFITFAITPRLFQIQSYGNDAEEDFRRKINMKPIEYDIMTLDRAVHYGHPGEDALRSMIVDEYARDFAQVKKNVENQQYQMNLFVTSILLQVYKNGHADQLPEGIVFREANREETRLIHTWGCELRQAELRQLAHNISW